MPRASDTITNPTSDVDPWAIANDPNLDHQTKIERLHQLEHDVRLIAVAQEEGMSGTTHLPSLADVLAALEQVSDTAQEAQPNVSDTKI